MISSASSVWRRRSVVCFGLWPPGWGASIMMLPSPGWSSGMSSGSARDCLQRSWQFRQSAIDAVHWRSLLITPFFYCPVVQPLCKLLEGFMVRILNRKFFVVEVSFVCSNVVPKNRQEHNVFFCLLGVMHVEIWTTERTPRRWVFFLSDPVVLL